MSRSDFVKFYKENYMPLGMLALRMLESVEEAEDVVQDAFVATWMKLEQGARVDDIRRYMYRAVSNGALMKMRSRKHEAAVPEDLPDLCDDEDIDVAERDARVWRAIDKLPPRCRDAFLMAKRDGMTHAEIAAEMDISVKTVEHQVAKAMSRLRDALSSASGTPFFLPFL